MNLFDSYSSATEKEWKDKITSDLKGAPIESLNWESELGTIDPVLFNYKNKYIRIPSKTNQPSNAWIITASFSGKNPKECNTEILKSLASGVNGILLYDTKASDLEIILKEVMIEIIAVRIFSSNAENNANLQTVMQSLFPKKSEHYQIIGDPIGQYISGLAKNIDLSAATAFEVQATAFGNSGGNIQHQLGMAIAQGHEYLVNQLENEIPFEQALANISFKLSIGNSYFAEMAKVKALRSLWHTVASEYGDATSVYTQIHAVTATLYQSNLDIHNNLLRGSTASMAAIIAGADTLEVTPYDNPSKKKRNDAGRLAKNIQLLLQEESYLNQVKNGSDGSYYIEQLTDIIITKSWDYFKELEELGGFIKAFESGKIIKDLHTDLKEKIAQFKNEDIILLGTNRYPNANEKNSEHYADYDFNNPFVQTYRLSQVKI